MNKAFQKQRRRHCGRLKLQICLSVRPNETFLSLSFRPDRPLPLGANSGIRISLINPGMVKTGFFDNLDFRPGDADDNYILPEAVAAVVLEVIETRSGTVIDEINMSPGKKVIHFKK